MKKTVLTAIMGTMVFAMTAAPVFAAMPNGEITKDEAVAIAMKDAGVQKKDVVCTEAEKNYDDGRIQYEVEFRIGQKEYSYNIGAKDGTILEHEIDMDD